jgi:hypothetical protein
VDAAARAFGISATFDNHRELLMHPGVDLVVVAVKVPNHHQIVAAALEAGKMVLRIQIEAVHLGYRGLATASDSQILDVGRQEGL